MRDLIGRSLGHYRIVDKIGEGGMGEVYRAHDERLDRDVAIKVLLISVAQDPERIARFEREAKAVAALSHPNILEIFDFATEGDITYAVTEFLEGKSLNAHLQKVGGRLNWRLVQEIGVALAAGLGAAHGKGLIHRDIKPSNIFLCSDGRVKILDFGVAAVRGAVDRVPGQEKEEAPSPPILTRDGWVMGTVGYMAPEQVVGRPADHRSDIFALGVVLYEMLTGRRAFGGDTTSEVMTSIVGEEVPSLADLEVDVPSDVAQTVERCLEKDPERRFQSAEELAVALGAESKATRAMEALGETPRVRRWAMPTLGAAGILVAVSAMVFGPGILDRLGGRPEQRHIRSIAVLPLQNLTGDPEQQYFVDGLHEELIATFARISGFEKVIARTSVMGYRDSDTPISEIADRLDVEAVIEGAVRRSGDTVRATLQLIDPRTEGHLWAESYERQMDDVFELQSEIARTVSAEVHVAITADEEARLEGDRSVHGAAYDAFLRGNHFLDYGEGEETIDRAIASFEDAIDLDPSFAPAYLGLSRALRIRHHAYSPDESVIDRSRAAVFTALELDPTSAEAHAVLGRHLYVYEWDWTGSERALKTALELGPGNSNAHRYYAYLLAITGRVEQAFPHANRAVELDPLSNATWISRIVVYALARRYEEAIEMCLEAIELFPKSAMYRGAAADLYSKRGLHAQALEMHEEDGALRSNPEDSPLHLKNRVSICAHAGDIDCASQALRRLLDLRSRKNVGPAVLAAAYAAMGDREHAIENLEKAYDERDTQISNIQFNDNWDAIRDDPRFHDIVRRMDFPEN
jgi:serine/threonine-protein kinase